MSEFFQHLDPREEDKSQTDQTSNITLPLSQTMRKNIGSKKKKTASRKTLRFIKPDERLKKEEEDCQPFRDPDEPDKKINRSTIARKSQRKTI